VLSVFGGETVTKTKDRVNQSGTDVLGFMSQPCELFQSISLHLCNQAQQQEALCPIVVTCMRNPNPLLSLDVGSFFLILPFQRLFGHEKSFRFKNIVSYTTSAIKLPILAGSWLVFAMVKCSPKKRSPRRSPACVKKRFSEHLHTTCKNTEYRQNFRNLTKRTEI
jgi:hypothetical protein